MSQNAETQHEPARTPGPIATALHALRLPLALTILAYLVLRFLISLVRILFGEGGSEFTNEASFSERIYGQQSSYLSLLTLIMLAAVVALVASREPLKLARPLVLTTLVLTGIGLLLGFIATLAYLFIDGTGPFNSGRDKFEATVLDLPLLGLYVLFGLFLLALLGSKGLPRTPKPQRPQQHGQQYPGGPPQGGMPGFPPVEQQQYGYQQQGQQQSPTYDPWQGYPQQGYQQQPAAPYQPEQPYQQPQAPYQPPQSEPAPYQPPQQPSQPDLSKQSEPSAPAEPNRPDAPPAWPSQPTQALPLPEQGQQRPEATPQQPGQVQDWYSDQRRQDGDTPPPYGN